MTDEQKQQTAAKKAAQPDHPWWTVHLPGHAVWETQAATKAQAIAGFVQYHHIKSTDREYVVYEGQVRDEVVANIKAGRKTKEKAMA